MCFELKTKIMSKNNTQSGGGIGFGTALLLIFVTLKLCHVINWSWWWVLSPLWIGVVLWALILGLFAIWNLPKLIKHNRKAKRIKELMKNMSYGEAIFEYNVENGTENKKPPLTSKWHQRLEEMRKVQNRGNEKI